ncbi:MAG: hypothetical protein ABIN94_04595 [Ferruginibacter sp.]
MKKPYVLSAGVLYVIAFFILFPQYQYLIDSDGISYIKVAERLAENNFSDALNGYWSPLSSWLLVPFIKMGFNAVAAAKYLNGLLGLLCIYSFSALIETFVIDSFLKKLLPFCFAFLTISFCFNELSADLLSLFILSLYFNIILNKKVISTKPGLLLAGLLGALAYFAKAYNFFFFLANISFTLLLYCKNEAGNYFSSLFFKRLGIALFSFLIITSPYLYSISKKYDHFTVNTAGGLNTSWQLAPGVTDSQRIVIPPPYYNAVSSWDDPTYQQKTLITPFTSGKYFYKQIRLTAHNCIVLIKILTQISISWIFCLPLFLFYSLRGKWEEGREIKWLLLFSTILYPAGYLLIVIEGRYVWILSAFILLMNAILVTEFKRKKMIGNIAFKFLTVILLVSFLPAPFLEMISLSGKHKYEHAVAAVLKREHITGKFLTIINNSEHQGSLTVICYLAKSQLMGAYKINPGFAELKQASKQYAIPYFIQLYERDIDKKELLGTDLAKSAVKIYDNLYPGMLIFQLY